MKGFTIPKGSITEIVYTLALEYSLYRYIGPKVYIIGVHGPLGYDVQVKGSPRIPNYPR